WNQFRVPGFWNGTCRKGQISRHRVPALTEVDLILSAAHNSVFVCEKISEPDALIRGRARGDQGFGRRVIAGRDSGRSIDVLWRNEITSDIRARPESFQSGAKGVVPRRGAGNEAVE